MTGLPHDVADLLSGLPAWVNWLAQDEDGSWWGYEVEPLRYDHGWYENEVGRRQRLLQSDPTESWQESLQRLRIL